jgi:hypothetical protein
VLAFWLRPDWTGGGNIRDPGVQPFWCRAALPAPEPKRKKAPAARSIAPLEASVRCCRCNVLCNHDYSWNNARMLARQPLCRACHNDLTVPDVEYPLAYAGNKFMQHPELERVVNYHMRTVEPHGRPAPGQAVACYWDDSVRGYRLRWPSTAGQPVAMLMPWSMVLRLADDMQARTKRDARYRT